jgi:hypothetical protein
MDSLLASDPIGSAKEKRLTTLQIINQSINQPTRLPDQAGKCENAPCITQRQHGTLTQN